MKKQLTNTEPVCNKVGYEYQLNRLMKIYQSSREFDKGLVAYFKSKLGKQDTCKTLGSENRRFYIWIELDWIVFVHDVYGYSLEVPICLNKQETQKSIKSFLNIMEG